MTGVLDKAPDTSRMTKDPKLTAPHAVSPLAFLIDAMLEDEGVELFVHYLDMPCAYIADDAGIGYALVVGDAWNISADEMAEVVAGIREAISAGDDIYVHTDGRHFRFGIGDEVITLRCLGGSDQVSSAGE